MHFFSTDKESPDQASSMRRLTRVFAVLMWRRDISHVAAHFYFSRQRSPDQAAWMHKLMWVFAVLMRRRTILFLLGCVTV